MLCPTCGNELVPFIRSGAQVHICRKCRGVWLDRGELDKIIQLARQEEAQPHPGAPDYVPPPPPTELPTGPAPILGQPSFPPSPGHPRPQPEPGKPIGDPHTSPRRRSIWSDVLEY